MITEETKETHSAGTSWFAIEDINRRAEHAMNQHPDVFGSYAHQTAVAKVTELVKDYLSGYAVIYETARPATRKRPAHTEVKVMRYVLKSKRDGAAFRKSVEAAGGKEMVWKHNTESLSIHVW
jgi:hypothetical protein